MSKSIREIKKDIIVKKRYKLSNQMIFVMSIFIAFILILFTFVIMSSIRVSELEFYTSNTESVNEYFETTSRRIFENVASLKTNYRVASKLYGEDTFEFREFLYDSADLKSSLITSLVIVDLVENKYNEIYNENEDQNIIENIKNVILSKKEFFKTSDMEFISDLNTRKNYILSKMYNDKIMILEINEEFFLSALIMKSGNKTEYGIISSDGIVIVDTNNNEIWKTIYDLGLTAEQVKLLNNTISDVNFEKIELDFRVKNSGYVFTPIHIKELNKTWLFVNKSDVNTLNKRSKSITELILISGFLLFIFLVITIRIVISRSLKPIDDIVNVMEEVKKGNFDIRVKGIPKNELKTIGHNLNDLLDKIVDDRNELILKNREISELLTEVEELVQENNRVYYETIKSLAKTIDAKDKYTGGHCDRVTKYSIMVAKELGLSEEAIKNLSYGAMLHDIGKIAIKESIITKKGKLTDEEYLEMKNHPKFGYDIINEINFLKEASIIVLEHHERVDGKGYPYGKKGDELRIESKIVMIADSFDAMTTNRSYRKALSLNEALSEIEKNKGTQFDEKVAKAFIKLIKSGKIKL